MSAEPTAETTQPSGSPVEAPKEFEVIPEGELPTPEKESEVLGRDHEQRMAQRKAAHEQVARMVGISFALWAVSMVIELVRPESENAHYLLVPALISGAVMTISLAAFLVSISRHIDDPANKGGSLSGTPGEAFEKVIKFISEMLLKHHK